MARRLWQMWDQFWFAPIDTFRFSVWRILLGCLMLWMNSIRAFSFREFYTDQGMVLHDQAADLMQEYYRPLIFLGNNTMTGFLFVMMMVLIVFFILGIGGRLTSFVLLMLHLSFIQRNFAVAYGVDLVVSCWLFYLTLTGSQDYLSLQTKWLRGSKPVERDSQRTSGLATSVGWRLMQIQLCVIYGYTGIEKLKGTPWWEGSAIWSVLGNKQLMIANFGFLQSFPTIVALMTFCSLAFEIYFPALVWIPALRVPLLLAGIAFHMGIAFTMGLLAFGLAMILGYLAFVDDRWLRGAFLKLSERFNWRRP